MGGGGGGGTRVNISSGCVFDLLSLPVLFPFVVLICGFHVISPIVVAICVFSHVIFAQKGAKYSFWALLRGFGVGWGGWEGGGGGQG